ncbi:RNA-guided endonuclease TnpB family protein [Lyngbya sp. PCC 8106]|uniref:RNA-guided endonuclease TnpB family protein n=1 Tax=Lyngbya sp. (strain PCC 8106) TaxID=313612 RepID=UPI0000EAA32D|nr:RNA-guided endonuclease TnpB family protein [Lyngbya sp. PCC 8106]EAW36946.1 Transposase [Lyngbya sp. PCC 8106]
MLKSYRAVLKQKLARAKDGSNTRKKIKRLVARVQSRIARCREDFLHKLSRKIVNDNQVIVVENLAVKNMVKNHNLAKAISDCGWGIFCTMLSYKAKMEGKVYLEVDRFFPSSRISHLTGYRFTDLKLSDRMLYDPIAEKWIDRDINAAINIKNEGLRILSLGTSDTANLRENKTGGKTSVLLDAFPLEDGNPVSDEVG